VKKEVIIMEKQNVTLSLPKPLLKKAKTLASKTEQSLSELMRKSLEEKIKESAGYKKARQRQMKLLRTGIDLGTRGSLHISREEIHARG
jgi:metal-responsive CopG/Arc/MetJ family transcriptional regulator